MVSATFTAGIACLLTACFLKLYLAAIVHPQIRDLERKRNLPEFQGTAHERTILFALKGRSRSAARLDGASRLLFVSGIVLLVLRFFS